MSEQKTATEQRQPVVGTAEGLVLPGGGTGALAGLEGRLITAVHPSGAEVWVLADRRDVYRVTEAVAERVAGLEGDASGTCLVVHGGSVWVGDDEAGLWRLDGGTLEEVASFQRAPTRDEWHTPWGGPPAVLSMAAYGDDLFVGVHVGGILRSSDGGTTWSQTIDLHDDVHQVVVNASGEVLAATGRSGLAHSTDQGETWRYHTDGLHAHYLLTVAATADGALVGASSGHAGRDGAIYRFDGERFERCGGGLPDDLDGAVEPRQLAAFGDEALVGLPNGDVYASADGGRTWSRIAEHLSGVSEVALHRP